MCPTSWLIRLASVKSALDNYNSALDLLQEQPLIFAQLLHRVSMVWIHCCLSAEKCVLGLCAILPALQAL